MMATHHNRRITNLLQQSVLANFYECINWWRTWESVFPNELYQYKHIPESFPHFSHSNRPGRYFSTLAVDNLSTLSTQQTAGNKFSTLLVDKFSTLST